MSALRRTLGFLGDVWAAAGAALLTWVVVGAVLAGLGGCGDNAVPPPTDCVDAFVNFFDVGCDPTATDDDHFRLAVIECRFVENTAPRRCPAEVDAWLRCIAEVTAGACGCEPEESAISACADEVHS